MKQRQGLEEVQASHCDRLGIGLSALCMVHCLGLPLLIVLLPVWSLGWALHAWIHPVLAALLIPITLVALYHARRVRHVGRISVLLSVGLLLVLAAWLGHDVLGRGGEAVVTLLGSGLLVSGHWQHWRVQHSLKLKTNKVCADEAPELYAG